jgi:LSD1 subclass zinc finger protein
MSGSALVTCNGCGAPLAPAPGSVRATCSYCGATSDVASEGALALAEKLKGKIRVAPRLMTLDEIEADIDERERQKRAASRHAMMVAAITLAIVGLVGLVAVLAL